MKGFASVANPKSTIVSVKIISNKLNRIIADIKNL